MKEDNDLRKSSANMKEYLLQAKETVKVFCWIWQDLVLPQVQKRAKWMVVLVFVAIAVELASSMATRYVVNGLVAHSLWVLGLGLAFHAFLKSCGHIANHLQEWFGFGVLMNARGNADQKVSAMFFEKSLEQHLQETLDLRQESVDKGREDAKIMLETLVYDNLGVIANTLVSYALVCYLSIVSGVVMGVSAVLHFSFAMYLNKRIANEYTLIEKEWRVEARYRRERHTLLERVKTSAKEQQELEIMGLKSQEVIAKDLKFWAWYRKFASLRGAVMKFAEFVVLAWGAWLVWSGRWDIGGLFPLIAWSSIVSGNMWKIAAMERRHGQRAPSVQMLNRALTQDTDVDPAAGGIELPPNGPVGVKFENVTFIYSNRKDTLGEDDDSGQRAIHNVSFEIMPGEKVALIGSSGAGKTTAIRAVLRFFDPTSGRILVNGHDLRELNLRSWLRMVGYFPQQAQIFDGTLRYNLTYALDDQARAAITDEELWQLVRTLKIDFEGRLRDDLDTVVGSRGEKLSGGERQRLMIGAATIIKPRLVVIDEATSNLDPETEMLVHQGLQEILSRDVSALIISHRLSTVRWCDRFVVLRNGKSLQDGEDQVEAIASSFEELYQISPTFRRLHDAEQRTRLL